MDVKIKVGGRKRLREIDRQTERERLRETDRQTERNQWMYRSCR